MSESTKELNAILRKYEVSTSQVAYWLYLTLERMTEEYRENHLEDLGEKEINRLDALADELNGLVNNHWHSIK
ncbi:hypothetical protein [Bacillus cereus group sp. BceL293]|uniref:hypothetical protein n=1 Tax=Bacillus cereus group sp. BceL293 TaxID=3444992 RepID=UPI003F299675